MRISPIFLTFALLCPSTALCEIPVSPVVLTATPGAQRGVKADSNGDIGLAAWSDARGGTYATRIAGDGTSLDPLGIALPGLVVEVVIWTGDEFLVITSDDTDRIFNYLTVDGTVRMTRRFAAGPAATREIAQSDGRLLLLQPSWESNVAMTTDYEGNVVAPAAELSRRPEGWSDQAWVAGGGPLGFLVLRRQSQRQGARSERLLAERIGLNGRLISTVDTGISYSFDENAQIVGHRNGWLVLRRHLSSQPWYIVERFDRDGVFIGPTETIRTPDGASITGAYLATDGERYVVAWQTAPEQGKSAVYGAEVPLSAGLGEARKVGEWAGTISDVTLAAEGGRRLLLVSASDPLLTSSFDVFAHALNEQLEPSDRRLLTHSATLQMKAELATGANGFLVAWRENGPDRFARVYLQRFSSSGRAQDSEPTILHQLEGESSYALLPEVRIVSNGQTYLVVWNTGTSAPRGRRMSADTGLWIDPEPVPLGQPSQTGAPVRWTVGSNGTDALFVSVGSCPYKTCMTARPVHLSGALFAGPPELLAPPGAYYDPAVASDGSDYLVVWSEGERECHITCTFDPYSIQASRVGSNGSPIDSQPIAIETRKAYSERPAVAWDGTRYLVAWSKSDYADRETRAARVTAEGSVSGVDPERGGTRIGGRTDLLLARSHRGAVALFAKDGDWSMATIPPGTPLEEIASLPRLSVAPAPRTPFLWEPGSLAATSREGSLVIAYERHADGIWGGVPRVFLRFLDGAPRRRAVSR